MYVIYKVKERKRNRGRAGAFQDIELIIGSLKNNKVLGEVLTLSDDQLRLLADAMHVVELPAHETLLSKVLGLGLQTDETILAYDVVNRQATFKL